MAGVQDMATLAQERLTRHQHMVIVRAMGVMAVQTVLPDRDMFPDKRSALVGVTAGAVGGHGFLYQHFRGRAAVRVMAGSAVHLPLLHRHMIASFDPGDDILMALVTNLHGPGLDKKLFLVLGVMNAVAGQARNVMAFMRAAHPMEAPFVLVALETGLAHFNGGHLFKVFDGGKARVGPVSGGGGMERARPMTGFTGLFKFNFF